MRVSQFLFLSALLVATTAPAASERRCPDLAAPPAPVCVATAHGLVYADTGAEAASASRAQTDAARRFELHFGRAPVGVLILSTSFDMVDARAFARTHGLEYAQVWLPVEATRAMTERAVRRAGIASERARQAGARSVQQSEAVLHHEMGHAMYAAVYWPDADPAVSTKPAYGTPAPDWLDEAAAILTEGAETQAPMLALFFDAAGRRRRSVPPLTDFVVAEHPVLSSSMARALARKPQSGSGVVVSVVSDKDAPGTETFYGQSLILALFLIETSGDTRILAPISAAIAEGDTFGAWLARNGAHHGLRDSLPALEGAWETWLEAVIQRNRDTAR